jgi:hypothetical protein
MIPLVTPPGGEGGTRLAVDQGDLACGGDVALGEESGWRRSSR